MWPDFAQCRCFLADPCRSAPTYFRPQLIRSVSECLGSHELCEDILMVEQQLTSDDREAFNVPYDKFNSAEERLSRTKPVDGLCRIPTTV